MAQAPSKPNPLHGAPKKEEVHMPGAPPKSDMAPHAPAVGEPALDGTKAEMDEGKKALASVEDRTKAEMDAGKAIISKLSQPANAKRGKHDDEDD